ncbi:hypothetical protein EIN_083720 [Entamoeba invadens IP1]|uniref:hypothetical protein n=1 Tax=Entamoeba invadens IP1 TaxID=370355 RepID=UPI0002C3D21D|nr:hypothetical protein EIN_083720 [Entamoeba invadens IP1]ELP85230.1 hypothetical protein EIN_083720 [Entamoeba invadens IP1]|eukprot:XP_004184576.1 hypothetical protein EIN_083720 [Entamoeba invadens IP1]
MYLTTSTFENCSGQYDISKRVDYTTTPLPTAIPPAPFLFVRDDLLYLETSFPLSLISNVFSTDVYYLAQRYGVMPLKPFLSPEVTQFHVLCNSVQQRRPFVELILTRVKDSLKRTLLARNEITVFNISRVLHIFKTQIDTFLVILTKCFASCVLSHGELEAYKRVKELLELTSQQVWLYIYESQFFLEKKEFSYPVALVPIKQIVPRVVMKHKALEIRVFLLSGCLIHLPTLKMPKPSLLSISTSGKSESLFETHATDFVPSEFAGGSVMHSVMFCTALKGTNKLPVDLYPIISIDLPKENGAAIKACFRATDPIKTLVITNTSQWVDTEFSLFVDCLTESGLFGSVPVDKLFNLINSLGIELGVHSKERQKYPFFSFEEALRMVNSILNDVQKQMTDALDYELINIFSRRLLEHIDKATKTKISK